MHPIFKNIMAVLAGIVIGSIVNMLILAVNGSIIPPPDTGDMTIIEILRTPTHLMEPKHFLFPFLAHAIGTLVGALIAALAAANNKKRLAMGVGFFFLIGGIANINMLPSPLWFTILDVTAAYLPMAYLGWKLSGKKA